MSNLCRYLLLTRLPKFHRGKGSRHLGYYVTYFFFLLLCRWRHAVGLSSEFYEWCQCVWGKQLQLRVQAGWTLLFEGSNTVKRPLSNTCTWVCGKQTSVSSKIKMKGKDKNSVRAIFPQGKEITQSYAHSQLYIFILGFYLLHRTAQLTKYDATSSKYNSS